MKLTQKALLAIMRRGQDYTSAYLSEYFLEPISAIDAMLCTLAEQGQVRMSSTSRSVMQFRRTDVSPPAGVDPQRRAEPSVPTVATFPVTRTFSGNLSGYDAQLSSQRSLAMLTRRS
jgi:hypothetical protein